jgi:hypothetical protein
LQINRLTFFLLDSIIYFYKSNKNPAKCNAFCKPAGQQCMEL